MNYSGNFDAKQTAADPPHDGSGAHFVRHVQIPSKDAVGGGYVVTAALTAAIGSGALTRVCGIPVELNVGDPVCRGDVIETAADGRVGLRFIDGTDFDL